MRNFEKMSAALHIPLDEADADSACSSGKLRRDNSLDGSIAFLRVPGDRGDFEGDLHTTVDGVGLPMGLEKLRLG